MSSWLTRFSGGFGLLLTFFFLFLIGQWFHASKRRCNGVVFSWLLGYSECSSYILPQVGIPIPRSLQDSTDHLGSYLLVKQMTAWLWCLEFCEPSWMNPLTQWTPFDLGQARMPYAKLRCAFTFWEFYFNLFRVQILFIMAVSSQSLLTSNTFILGNLTLTHEFWVETSVQFITYFTDKNNDLQKNNLAEVTANKIQNSNTSCGFSL